jgi:hypothetical protein
MRLTPCEGYVEQRAAEAANNPLLLAHTTSPNEPSEVPPDWYFGRASGR